MVLLSRNTRFPSSGWMFMARPSAGFGISRVLGSAAPTRIAAGDAASSACHTPSRRWKRGNPPPSKLGS